MKKLAVDISRAELFKTKPLIDRYEECNKTKTRCYCTRVVYWLGVCLTVSILLE